MTKNEKIAQNALGLTNTITGYIKDTTSGNYIVYDIQTLTFNFKECHSVLKSMVKNLNKNTDTRYVLWGINLPDTWIIDSKHIIKREQILV